MHHAAGQVLQPAHVQRHTKATREPTSQADVVWVHVCGENALEWPCQRPVRHEGQPVGHGVGVIQAGIYQHPAIMGIYGPYIDVVESEWHRQSDPAYARGDLDPVS